MNVDLPAFGKPDQSDVGHQPELQLQPALLAVFALLGEARCPPLVRQELGVAAPASPTGSREPAVAVVDEFGEHVTGVHVEHDGAHRHGDLERLAPATVHVLALAVHPIIRPTVRVVAEREERRHVVIGDQPDVAAVAAITAVRSAHRLGTFTAEADAARAAITTSDVQLALVDELRHFFEANAPDATPSPIVFPWSISRSRTRPRIAPNGGLPR